MSERPELETDGTPHDEMVPVSPGRAPVNTPFVGRPYLECPHCSEFYMRLWRRVRYVSTSWLPFVGETVTKVHEEYRCKHCGYDTPVYHNDEGRWEATRSGRLNR